SMSRNGPRTEETRRRTFEAFRATTSSKSAGSPRARYLAMSSSSVIGPRQGVMREEAEADEDRNQAHRPDAVVIRLLRESQRDRRSDSAEHEDRSEAERPSRVESKLGGE